MAINKGIKELCSGTMTHAAFFSMIRSLLRRKSMQWKPIRNTLDKARRPNKSENRRLKWEYICHDCKNWFPGKEVVVDHIMEVGSLTCYEDLGGFVKNLFCEEDNLRVVCNHCHDIKTNKR